MASDETKPGFQEEQASFGGVLDDDEMFDMVNLSTRRTGISGIVFISTRRASHGPRVKWFPGKAEWEAPCLVITLESPLRVLNLGLPTRVAREGEAIALPWVERNKAALLRFWHDGLSWDSDDVQAFIDGLAKLP